MLSMTMSHSARKLSYLVITESCVRDTPRRRASAWASYPWKAWRLPSLLAKGSELGWAHSTMVPLSLIWAKPRAAAGAPGSSARARRAARPAARLAGTGRVPSVALEMADVVDDALDLRVAERALEGRHRAFLAVLYAVDDEGVAALGARELWPFPVLAPAVLVAPAAPCGEEFIHLRVAHRLLF